MQEVADRAFGTESWANRVAAACFERYQALPRAGKPGADEWAPLAGVVAFVPLGADLPIGGPTLKVVERERHSVVSKAQDQDSNKFNDDISLTSKTLTLASSGNLPSSSNAVVPPCSDIETLSQEPVTHLIKTPCIEADSIGDANHLPVPGSIKFLNLKRADGTTKDMELQTKHQYTSSRLTTDITLSQPPSRAPSEEVSVVPQAQETALSLHQGTNEMESHKIYITTPSKEPATPIKSPPIPAKQEESIVPSKVDKFLDTLGADTVARDPETRCFETLPREIPTSQSRTNPAWGATLLEGGVFCRYETPPPEGVVKCVALGTGSKCLGGNELRGGGVRVHDSHAEVLARRGFLRYLLHQAERALTVGDSAVLEAGPTGCRVRPGVSFHAFVSEPPCGDAAIFPSDEHARRVADRDAGRDRPRKRRRDDEDGDSTTAAKRFSRESRKEDVQERSGQCESRLADVAHQTSLTATHSALKAPDNDADQTANSKSSDIGKNLQDFTQKPILTILEGTSTPESNAADVTVNEKSSDVRILQKCSQKQTENAQKDIIIQEINAENSSAGKKSSDAGRISQESIQKATEDAGDVATMHECSPADATASATASDVHRTGAKCVGGGVQDRHAPGAGYHVTGAVRTKPGRGDPTLSLSCSDKMARWHAVGVQGALLSLLVPSPVRYRSVALAGGVTWSAAALRRALTERACANSAPLAMAQATLRSPAGRGDCARPCAAGVVWCDVPHMPHEVVARGLKQGVTKKAASTPAGRLKISRKELAKEFVRVYSLAATRFSRCSVNQMTGLCNKNLGLDSLGEESNIRNQDMKIVGQVIDVGADNGVAVNCGLAYSIVLEDQCKHPLCQNGMTDCKGDAVDKVDIRAFKSDANFCNNDDNRGKSSKCLVENDVYSSTAKLGGFYDSVAGEAVLGNDRDGDQEAKNGKSFNESFGNVTYAQMKAMACNYQCRWRHVRESHFPVWSVKPSGLQDFIVSDD